MSHPITLQVKKKQVLVYYRLQYKRHFPFSLHEKVIKGKCSAGKFYNNNVAEDSTCKYKRDAQGKAIPYSGGFCCGCGSYTKLFGIQDRVDRGANCGFMKFSGTAHCLELTKPYFAAYKITEKFYQYEIEILYKYFSKSENRYIEK